MLKLDMNDMKITDLTDHQLQRLSWTSVTVNDLKNIEMDFIQKHFEKFQINVQRSLLKLPEFDVSAIDSTAMIDLISSSSNYNGGYYLSHEVFEVHQFPYDVCMKTYQNRSFGKTILMTQKAIPLNVVISNMSWDGLSEMVLKYNRYDIMDYLINAKNKSEVKKLKFIKSTEAKKVGYKVSNPLISIDTLKSASACELGTTYCKKVFKVLNLEQIYWDDMIDMIRNNPELMKKYQKIYGYVEWLWQYMVTKD